MYIYKDYLIVEAPCSRSKYLRRHLPPDKEIGGQYDPSESIPASYRRTKKSVFFLRNPFQWYSMLWTLGRKRLHWRNTSHYSSGTDSFEEFVFGCTHIDTIKLPTPPGVLTGVGLKDELEEMAPVDRSKWGLYSYVVARTAFRGLLSDLRMDVDHIVHYDDMYEAVCSISGNTILDKPPEWGDTDGPNKWDWTPSMRSWVNKADSFIINIEKSIP